MFEVFLLFLRLGLTSFGGPVAHLGYFRGEFVERRKWLDETGYADIVALCQFLPGPASSQVAVTLGILRAGLAGGFAAWLGFTLPSAVALVAFGATVARMPGNFAWMHGLKIVAVAVVAQAVWSMARTLCPDRERATLAIAAAALVLAWPSAAGQISAIASGGIIGLFALRAGSALPPAPLPFRASAALAFPALAVFVLLLFGLPILAAQSGNHGVDLFARFYRAGSLVFGGGHVVLPLLQQAVVPDGFVDKDAFLAGYGAAQAVPGPLFTFAAYLGTVMREPPNGLNGAMLCLVAIYLPSFLLLIGILPFWDFLRRRIGVQAALRGVNAAVVGLLLAALYTPVWTSAIFAPVDFAIAASAFLMLAAWRVPPWLVVILGALATEAIALAS